MQNANVIFFVFLLSSVSWKAMQCHGWEDKGIGLDSYLGGPPCALLENGGYLLCRSYPPTPQVLLDWFVLDLYRGTHGRMYPGFKQIVCRFPQ